MALVRGSRTNGLDSGQAKRDEIKVGDQLGDLIDHNFTECANNTEYLRQPVTVGYTHL